jgi:hypothetical protein
MDATGFTGLFKSRRAADLLGTEAARRFGEGGRSVAETWMTNL